MADIIRCSGGEVLTTLPDPLGVGVLIGASLSTFSSAVVVGVAIHIPELIRSGVLRQKTGSGLISLISRMEEH